MPQNIVPPKPRKIRMTIKIKVMRDRFMQMTGGCFLLLPGYVMLMVMLGLFREEGLGGVAWLTSIVLVNFMIMLYQWHMTE